jgi:lysophospholipase L1-like esterase
MSSLRLWLGCIACAAGLCHAETPGAGRLPLKQGARILFQGDSITDGARGRNLADQNHVMGHGYAFLIAADLGGHHPQLALDFQNRGVSGNTVDDLARRWPADTLALKPDVLSVLVGVNDAGSAWRDKKPFDAAAFERTYDRLLTEVRAANPDVKLVLCEPFIGPAREGAADWDVRVAAVAEAREVVARLAAKHRAPLVRFQQLFDDLTKEAPLSYWIWDGVHPTYRGHQRMADEWLRVVRAAWPAS